MMNRVSRIKNLKNGLCVSLFLILTGASLARPAESGTYNHLRNQDQKTYRIAMSAAFVSQDGMKDYKRWCNWLAKKTGAKFEFIEGLGYEEISAMMADGAVDLGFICGYPYVLLRDRPNPSVELLAAPIPSGKKYADKPQYFSELIVRKGSPYHSLGDLRGRTYVFNEETSNSGYIMARYRMKDKTNGFFHQVLRSGSHEESIRMVASGQADASFVDSLVLDYEKSISTAESKNVTVIERVGPAGIVPLVVSTKIPTDLRKKWKEAVIHMHDDPEGKAILASMYLKRFEAVADSNYDNIRRMNTAAIKGGFTKIQAGG